MYQPERELGAVIILAAFLMVAICAVLDLWDTRRRRREDDDDLELERWLADLRGDE